MEFINPSLKQVFDTLVGNDDLVNFLKEKGLVLTRQSLYNQIEKKTADDMQMYVYLKNVQMFYDIAEILLQYSDQIKSTQIWQLKSHRVAWDDLAGAMGITSEDLTGEIYHQIMYCYKYCVVSSFFQNNKDRFMPEEDFYNLEQNGAGMAFYDAMMKEFDKLDCVIGKCVEYMDYDQIPWDLLSYLTQLLGFEKSTLNADEDIEEKFRELAKNILDIYRIKGTEYSFQLLFNFLGFNIEIREYYFDRRLYYTTNEAGNSETSSADNADYQFYLTVHNPTDNELGDISISETVMPQDLTPQYSLHEFNELCNEYGPAAVLGYTPFYEVKDEAGRVIGTKEYTGKVYKYFKTNLIYYSVGLDKGNLNEKQIIAVTKYLDFLTPSYVMRQIEIETYMEKAEEGIGFDGDGTKKADIYGNFEGFEILDSEDWERTFEDSSVKKVGNKIYKVKDNEYDGTNEKLEEYTNSIGESKYRLPLGYKINRVSTSKYLTCGTGTNYLSRKRVKYYIHRYHKTLNSFSYTDDNVIITPYYTIPPFVGNTHYNLVDTNFYEQTEQVNLLGGDGNGGEKCVKTLIRDANIRRPVEFTTELTLEDFLNSNDEKFNELTYGSILNRELALIFSVKYGNGQKYRNIEEAYKAELLGYHICNVDNNNFKIEDVYKDTDITYLYKHADIIKALTLNKCILSYSGSKTSGTLKLYRYTPVKLPIKNANYDTTYVTYLRSFRYKLVKAYNHSLTNNGSVSVEAPGGVMISGSYITKTTLVAAEAAVQDYYNRMIELTEKNPSDSSKWLDIDYIENKIFYISSTGDYYIATKYAGPSVLAASRYGSGKTHIFDSLENALQYFEQYPDEKHCNAEFYVNGEGLYAFHYKNRYRPVSIFSIADEQLYKVIGNGRYDIIKDSNFFGSLSIKEYIEDPNGIYVEGDDTLMYDYGYINGMGIAEIEYENGFKKIDDKTLNHTGEVRTRYREATANDSEENKLLKAEINDYDVHWTGYDEEADEQDFIFYNSEHKINWDNLGIVNEVISRPVKSMTDKNFDADEDETNLFKTKAQESDSDNYGNYALEGYYKTLGQRLVGEIVENTANNFTDKEKINWSKSYNYYPIPVGTTILSSDEIYEKNSNNDLILTSDTTAQSGKEYYTYSCIGLLSIIEENMEKITGASYDRTFDYYSTVSQFFVDYYRLIVLGNTTESSIPSKILKDYGGTVDNDLIVKINRYYKRAMLQIAGIVDTISQNRVFYAYIGNWKSLVAPNISKYTDTANDGCWINDYYDDPLNSAAINKDGYRKDLGEGRYYYYFNEKNAFVNIIKSTIEKLDANFSTTENGNKVKHYKIDELDDYLGVDAYSLKVNNKYDDSNPNVSPWHNVFYENGWTHYYQDYRGSQTLRITDKFYLLRDSNYNYFIPYALKYGLRNYSKDFYDEHREIYSEFTEVVDLFRDGIKEEACGFLKQYYYNKLTSLYREANINDTYPLGVKTDGKKPMQLMPKLSEKFNGLAGQYRSAGTLLSSYYNNGGENDTGIKLRFFKFDVSVDENLKATMKFYVRREDFISAFGYDFNKYFIKKDLEKVSSSTLRAQLKEAIDLMYKKQFSNIKPSFMFYDEHPSYYPIKEDVYEAVKKNGKIVYEKKIITNRDGTTSVAKKEVPSVWQTIRSKLSCDYSEAEALLTDENYKPITDDTGNIVDASGQEINLADSALLRDRLNEAKYVIITVENKKSLLKTPEAVNVFQIDGHQNEERNNIYGYLSVKQLKQSFIDNYISFPKSLEWIEKDENNIASEYISFGDDRAINITINNNLFIKYDYIPSEDLIVFFDKEYYRLVDGEYVRVCNRELETISNPSEAGLYTKEISANGEYYNKYTSIEPQTLNHSEEVIKVSSGGYPYVYEGDQEKVLVSYDKHLLLEDQGYKPVYYAPTASVPVKASADSYKKTIIVDGEEKINYVCDNIYYDTEGNLILELGNDYLHTSNLKSLKMIYKIAYLTIVNKKISPIAWFGKGNTSFFFNPVGKNSVSKFRISNAVSKILTTIRENLLFKTYILPAVIKTKSNVRAVVSKFFGKALVESIKALTGFFAKTKNIIVGTKVFKKTAKTKSNVRAFVIDFISRYLNIISFSNVGNKSYGKFIRTIGEMRKVNSRVAFNRMMLAFNSIFDYIKPTLSIQLPPLRPDRISIVLTFFQEGKEFSGNITSRVVFSIRNKTFKIGTVLDKLYYLGTGFKAVIVGDLINCKKIKLSGEKEGVRRTISPFDSETVIDKLDGLVNNRIVSINFNANTSIKSSATIQ